MKKLTKVLTLVLAMVLAAAPAAAPATEAQAATKTIRMDTNGEAWHLDGKKISKTGNYNVKIFRDKGGSTAWINFRAPKAGVYQIKMSNLHSAKDKEGLFTDVDVCTWVTDKDLGGVSRTCYFSNAKDYNSIYLCGKKYYEFCQSISKKQYKNFVKNTTINCKLKKGDHLTIKFDRFQGVDALNTIDTFAFDMKITKK